MNLSQTAKIARSNLFLIVLGVFSVTIFTLFIIATLNSKPAYKGISWENQVFPGQTTVQQLKKSLGEPIRVDSDAGQITYFYPTTNENRPVAVQITNETVQKIKEPVIAKEKGSLKNYISDLGKPEAIFYGDHGFAAPGNFWGSKGIMVFGNDISGLIVEVWYFPPTNTESFLQQNPSLSVDPPIIP